VTIGQTLQRIEYRFVFRDDADDVTAAPPTAFGDAVIE